MISAAVGNPRIVGAVNEIFIHFSSQGLSRFCVLTIFSVGGV